MQDERRLPTRTPESRAFAERVQVVMELTARLNVLPFGDLAGRNALLSEILGGPVPETLTLYPPFYCDYGLGIELGERVFINQGCFFLDLGGITIGDRVMIGPGVTLSTAGHPVEPSERYDFITHAPIVIESHVWIGAGATITPGVTIGRGSVVGAGTVVATDVPAFTVVTGGSAVQRKRLTPAPLGALRPPSGPLRTPTGPLRTPTGELPPPTGELPPPTGELRNRAASSPDGCGG